MTKPTEPKCLACSAPLTRTLVDLGSMALANSYVAPNTPPPDPVFTQQARVCDNSRFVQVEPGVPPEAILKD
jgi:hypothetical protein